MSVPAAVMSAQELRDVLVSTFGPDVPVVDAVTDVGVNVRMIVSGRHERPGGTVSGPAIMALADTVAWMALMSRVGPELLAVTTSLHIDFLRKPALVDVIAEGEIVKLGRRLVIVNVRVRSDGDERLVATASVTYSRPSAPSYN